MPTRRCTSSLPSRSQSIALALAIALTVACAPTTDAGPSTPSPGTAPTPRPASAPAATPSATLPDVDFVIAVQATAQGFDPRERIDPMSLQRMLVVMEPLVTLDASLSLKPRLATAWEVGDGGRVVTMRLRDDVAFHDGWRFTSTDVRFTIETGAGPDRQGTVRPVATLVERVETPDDQTVVLHLTRPAAHVLFELARMPIVPANAAEDFDTRPVGTGPYAFEAHAPGSRLVLRRNDAYWGDHTGPERIAFDVISRSADTVDAVLAGRVQLAHRAFEAADIQRLTGAAGVTVERVANTTVTYLAFDTTTAPLDDARVRRALSMLAPRDEIVSDVLHGNGVASLFMVPPSAAWVQGADTALLGGRTEAEVLLAEADARFDRPLVLVTNTSEVREATAARIVAAFANVGIEVRTEIVDFPTYLRRLNDGDYDLFVLGGVTTGNPSTAINTALNYEVVAPDISALLDQAATIDPTSDEGVATYRAAYAATLESSPRAFLHLGVNVGVMPAGLGGWAPHPADAHAYQDLHRLDLR